MHVIFVGVNAVPLKAGLILCNVLVLLLNNLWRESNALICVARTDPCYILSLAKLPHWLNIIQLQQGSCRKIMRFGLAHANFRRLIQSICINRSLLDTDQPKKNLSS